MNGSELTAIHLSELLEAGGVRIVFYLLGALLVILTLIASSGVVSRRGMKACWPRRYADALVITVVACLVGMSVLELVISWKRLGVAEIVGRCGVAVAWIAILALYLFSGLELRDSERSDKRHSQ
jgi:hypothetical protein